VNYLEKAKPEELKILAGIDPNRVLQDNRIPQNLKWNLIAQIYTAQAITRQLEGEDVDNILKKLPDDHPVAVKVKTYYDQYKDKFIPKPPTTMTPEEAYQVAEEITPPIPTPVETTPQVAQPTDTTLRQQFLQSPKEVFVTYEDLLKLQKGEIPEKPLITIETLQKQFPEFIKPAEMYPTRPTTKQEAQKISEKIKETSMKRVAVKVPKDRVKQYKAGFWWTLADYFDPILGEARRNKQVMEKLYPELKQDPLYKAQTVAGDVAGTAGRLVLLMAGLNNGIAPSTLVSKGLSPTRMVRLFKNPEVARILTNVINNAADMVALGKAFRLSEYAKVYDTLPEKAKKEFITKELTRNTALDAAFGAMNGLILSSPALRFTQETVKEQVRLGKTLRLPEITEIETRLPHYIGSFITGYAYAKGLGLDDKRATQFGLLNFGLTYFGLRQQPKLRRDFARQYLAKVLREQKPDLSMQDALQIADDLMKATGEQIWKQYTIRYPRPTKAGQSLNQYIRLETRNLAEFLSDPNVQAQLYKRIANKFVNIKTFRQAINDAVQTALQTTQAQEVQTITPSETPVPEVQPVPTEAPAPTVPVEAPIPVPAPTPTTPVSSSVIQNFTNLLSQYKEFIPENKQQVYQKTIERASAGDEEALAHIEDATGTYFREVRNGEGEIDYVGNNKLLDEALKRSDIKSIGMVDMNGLKYINDNYQHNVGDEYLYQFVQLAKSIPDVYIFRTGGDEFVITSTKYSPEELKTLLDEDTEIVLPDGKTLPVSFTAFIMPAEGRGKEALSRADELINLYKNKFRTRGKLVPKLVVGIGDLTKLDKIVNIINHSNIDNLQKNLEAIYEREGRIYEGRAGEREGGGVPTVPREPEAGVSIREAGELGVRGQQRGKRKTAGVPQRRRVTIRNLSLAQIRQIENAGYQLIKADQTKKAFTFEVENPEEFKQFVKQVKEGRVQESVQEFKPTRVTQIGLSPEQIQTLQNQGFKLVETRDNEAIFEVEDIDKFNKAVKKLVTQQVKESQKPKFTQKDFDNLIEQIYKITDKTLYDLNVPEKFIDAARVEYMGAVDLAKWVSQYVPEFKGKTWEDIKQMALEGYPNKSQMSALAINNAVLRYLWNHPAVVKTADKIRQETYNYYKNFLSQLKSTIKSKPQVKKQPDFVLHLHDILKGLNIDKIAITNNGKVVKFELTGHQAKKGYRLIADYFETAKVGGIYPTSQREGLHYSYDDVKQVWGELPKGRQEFKLTDLEKANRIVNGHEDIINEVKDSPFKMRKGAIDAELFRQGLRFTLKSLPNSIFQRFKRELGLKVSNDELRKILADFPVGVEKVLDIYDMTYDEQTQYFKDMGYPKRFGSRRAEASQKRMIDNLIKNSQYDGEHIKQWIKEFLGADWEILRDTRKARRAKIEPLTYEEAIAIISSIKNYIPTKLRRIGIHPLYANYLFSENWNKPYISQTSTILNSAPLYYTPFWIVATAETVYEWLLNDMIEEAHTIIKKYQGLDFPSGKKGRKEQMKVWDLFDVRWNGRYAEHIPKDMSRIRQLPHSALIPFVLNGTLNESVLDKGENPELDRKAHECVKEIRRFYDKYAKLLQDKFKLPDEFFQEQYYHRIHDKHTEKWLKDKYPSLYTVLQKMRENVPLSVGMMREARNIPGFDLSWSNSLKHYAVSVARAIAYAPAAPFVIGMAKIGGVLDKGEGDLIKQYMVSSVLGRDLGREELQKLFHGHDIGNVMNLIRTGYYDATLLLNFRPMVKNIFQSFLTISVMGSRYFFGGWANMSKYLQDPKFRQLIKVGGVEQPGLYELPTETGRLRRIAAKFGVPYKAWKKVDLFNRMGVVAAVYEYGKANGWTQEEIERMAMQMLAITQWLYLVAARGMWQTTRAGSIMHKATAFVKWPTAFIFDHMGYLARKGLWGSLLYELFVGLFIAFLGWLIGVDITEHIMPHWGIIRRLKRKQLPSWMHQLWAFIHDWGKAGWFAMHGDVINLEAQWDTLKRKYYDIPTVVQWLKLYRAARHSSYLVDVYGDDIPWWHWTINVLMPTRRIKEMGIKIQEKRKYDNEYQKITGLVRRHLYNAYHTSNPEKMKKEMEKAYEIYRSFFIDPKIKEWALRHWFFIGDVYDINGKINEGAIFRRFLNYVSRYEDRLGTSSLERAYRTGVGHTPYTDLYIKMWEQGNAPNEPSLLEQFKKFMAK